MTSQEWDARMICNAYCDCTIELIAEGWKLLYRFDWPRTNFFTFFFCEPRGVVRLALGAAFFRAVRFAFFRSSLSSIFLVFATGEPLSVECL